MFRTERGKVGLMLAIAISLLFGVAAFVAITQVVTSVGQGMRRRRAIMSELERDTQRVIRLKPTPRPARYSRLAAA